MPRNIFKQYTPSPETIRGNPALKFLGFLLHDPNLFHLNRHSVSVAFFVGLFIAFLPLPMQTAVAAAGALLFRCNLPISIGLVWVSNPVTYPFIFFACYKFGARILQLPSRSVEFQLSVAWLQSEFLLIWQPLLLGCLLAGLFFGCAGYITIQWSWRWHVVKRWEQRKLAQPKRK